MIHPINITDLEKTISSLTSLSYERIKGPLKEVIRTKARNLYSNLLKIKPTRNRLARSIDFIGTTWKWIGGSPDAEDLSIINTTMNKLIDGNNQQAAVNMQLDKRIRVLSDAIRKLGETNNEFIIDELEAITMSINIDVINRILEEIQETIIWTKASIVNSKLLSAHEVNTIRLLLTEQGMNITIPDEALKLIRPRIALDEDNLLYILQIPKLEEEIYNVLQIYPTVVNGSVIEKLPMVVLQGREKLYITSEPNKYVQQPANIRSLTDECIANLMTGKSSQCKTRKDNTTRAVLIEDGTILINNAKSNSLKFSCGPDNRTINGNFLIRFRRCTITFNNQTFSAETIHNIIEPYWGPITGTATYLQPTPEEDFDEKFINREELEHVYLRKLNFHWNLRILGGTTLPVIFIIILAVYAVFFYRKTVRGISNALPTIGA